MSLEALNRLIVASGCFSGGTIGGWTVDPAVLVPLLVGGMLYGVGVANLWRAAGVGRGARWTRVVCFTAGWCCTAAAIASPLHDLSRRFFTAHMIEHELVMTIAAPLLVAAQPLGVLLWAFPGSWRPAVARAARTLAYLVGWGFLSRPLVATALHAAAIWLWHIPVVFDAALTSEVLHWLQHLSFFVSAMFFWWAVLGVRQNRGIAIACLFLTALHTGFLGILIAMAGQPMYPAQAAVAAAFGADPLADQQLAGLIMWIPAGIGYVVAGLVLAGLWISRSSAREAAASPPAFR